MDNEINNKKISVIMPAYNAGLFIDNAIQSVVNQVYNNWELIIVDDGSTDDTASKVLPWLSLDSRIHYFYQENSKQGKARNHGISLSQGTYLAFLDADDLWLPEKLSVQILEIQKHNVDLVFSNTYVFNDYESENLSQKMNVPTDIFYDINSVPLFLEDNRIPILTVLVKKTKVIAVGGFSESLEIQNAEDYHLWLKLLLEDNVFYSSKFISAKYRLHNNSATSKDKEGMNILLALYFDLLLKYPKCKCEIQTQLKLKFKRIYKTNLFTKLELALWIKKNTRYLQKSKFRHFYLLLNFIFPTKFTKRLLIHVLNE
ncbi:glycosyltransferase family 2 protein [Flavobacterium sp.]|uniref:glycosyltransferase family 2 protein n=1 Tax=Flavobacterium sp. TaxID=239 RepID=UPI00260E834B|nr:glycosyltransferase family 2 protein [Flavobacterium sp.]MDG2433717.1 glycosyltransferase family 2 protein [Flavobacterium sp.]